MIPIEEELSGDEIKEEFDEAQKEFYEKFKRFEQQKMSFNENIESPKLI